MKDRPRPAPSTQTPVRAVPAGSAHVENLHENRLTRLRRIAAHPDAATARATPTERRRKEPWGGLVAALAVVGAAAASWVPLHAALGADSTTADAVPVLVGAIGLLLAFVSWHKISRLRKKPVTPLVAIVVHTRSESQPTRVGTTTRVQMTALEFEDGSRVDFPTDRPLAGTLKNGDAGVAWVHDRHLVDFRRIDA